MASLTERLQALAPTIWQICNISGTPGASVGVMKGGTVVFQQGFGKVDVSKEEKPDESTIYHVASLTKGISAAALGLLVDEGKLSWNQPVREILPEFHLQDQWVGEHVTLVDILTHRVGIMGGNALWSQGGNGNHLPKSELIKTLGSLRQVQNFRDSFLYHNLGYALIADIVERVTDQTYGTFVTERIFRPLGMDRSILKVEAPEPSNYAKAYIPMDDMSFAEIPRPESKDGTIQASAGGVRTCVKDLLIFYNELLEARKAESSPAENCTSHTIKQAVWLTAGHSFTNNDSPLERSYALGLIRTQTPGTFGMVGPNPRFVTMPVIGEGDRSRLIIYHNGSYPGFLSCVFLVPEEDLVIVVLSNSLAMNDAADWIGQLLLEHALDVTTKHDFLELASKSKESYLQSFVALEEKVKAGKDAKPVLKSLHSYTGDYYNSIHNFYIRVFEQGDSLRFCFQGEDWDVYELHGYQKDIFTWAESREQQGKRGRWPSPNPEYFKFTFGSNDQGQITHLFWPLDHGVAETERFNKEPLGNSNFGKTSSSL